MAARARFLLRYVLRRAVRRERVFRDRTNPLEMYNDNELFDRFRFRREDILYLSDLLRDQIDHPLPRKGSLPIHMQVMVALRFYAGNCFQIVVGDLFGLDKGTVSRVVNRVSRALAAHLNEFVKFQRLENTEEMKRIFFGIAGFPNVVGCIDCTHVNILAPTENEAQFVNRHGVHSINVQLVCDANLTITNCVVNWPGSVNDSRILRESALFAAYERGENSGILLGDGGYALQHWLMTPFINPDTAARQNYNAAHKSTRQTIERTNGILKRRWHCLKETLRYTPEKACKIIISCIILHNIATTLGLPEPPADDDESSEDEPNEDNWGGMEVGRGARMARDWIVGRYFQQ